MNRMSGQGELTLCYIVKDSIKKLPKSYFKMRTLTSDIIVVDTDSKDGTFEWAKSRCDVEAYKIGWHDNFSEARNFAIQKCLGKYILFIDDDELIPQSFFPIITNTIKNPGKAIDFSFPVVNYLQNPEWVKNPLVLNGVVKRLFLNDGNLKYQNRVHEKIVSDGRVSAHIDVPILHFQFESYAEMKEKMDHRRSLIHKDIIDSGKETDMDAIHLANTYRETYRVTGDYNLLPPAIAHLEKANKIKWQKMIADEINNLRGEYDKRKEAEN